VKREPGEPLTSKASNAARESLALTPDEDRGRVQLIGVAAATWLPPLVGALFGAHGSLLAALVPSVLLVGTWRGWHWARTWTTVTLGLGAIGAGVGTVLAVVGGSWPSALVNGVTAVSWGLAAITLERSEAVDAYCERQQ